MRALRAYMTPEELAEFDALVDNDNRLFYPTPGPQMLAYYSEADIIGYGGAAGGGKSALVTGLAMSAGRRTLIVRQEKVSTRKFVQDIASTLGSRDGYSSQTSSWSFNDPDGVRRTIEFAGLENEGDEEKQQGVDYDHKCVGAGTLVWMADGSRKPVERVAVGDMVDTLEGPRRVTRTMRKRDAAVLVVTGSGRQVQGVSHRLLGPDGWLEAERAEDRPVSTHHGFSSPRPNRAARICVGSLSRTCAALRQLRGIRSGGRPRKPLCGPGRAGCRCTSGTAVGTARKVPGNGCGSRCGLSQGCGQRLSRTPLRKARVSVQLRLSGCAGARTARRSDALYARPASSLAGCSWRCSIGSCRGDALLRGVAAGARACLRRRACAGLRTPTYWLVYARRQTPTHSRRTWSFDHPYSSETRSTDRSVRVEQAAHYDAGVVPLFDLTVEGANHYITDQGFINKNCYDEVTQMRETQVRYTMGWVRTAIPGQRCRVYMTFNPPTTPEGRWVIKFFAPWLDKKHPNPAADGELRWFATVDGNPDYELPVEMQGRSFVIVANRPCYEFDPADYRPEQIVTPKSRTFIRSKVTDNPYYMATGYISQLQGLPEPLRTQMLHGDFDAGVEDAANQLIPTAWIEAAMDRWRPRDAKGEMSSMGVDAARGGNMGSTLGAVGRDKMVIARRHGNWFDKLVAIKGADVRSGSLAAAQMLRFLRDSAPIHLDVAGIGTSPYDVLTENSIHVEAINNAAASKARDKTGLFGFVNLRAELYWRFMEALDPNNPDPIALPDDAELLADLAAMTYKIVGRGIQMESKDEIKKRLQRSTDKGDAVVMANVDTPKRQLVVRPPELPQGVVVQGQSWEAKRLKELEG